MRVAARACSRSVRRSSVDSMPTDSRTRPSVMPAFSRCSASASVRATIAPPPAPSVLGHVPIRPGRGPPTRENQHTSLGAGVGTRTIFPARSGRSGCHDVSAPVPSVVLDETSSTARTGAVAVKPLFHGSHDPTSVSKGHVLRGLTSQYDVWWGHWNQRGGKVPSCSVLDPDEASCLVSRESHLRRPGPIAAGVPAGHEAHRLVADNVGPTGHF